MLMKCLSHDALYVEQCSNELYDRSNLSVHVGVRAPCMFRGLETCVVQSKAHVHSMPGRSVQSPANTCWEVCGKLERERAGLSLLEVFWSKEQAALESDPLDIFSESPTSQAFLPKISESQRTSRDSAQKFCIVIFLYFLPKIRNFRKYSRERSPSRVFWALAGRETQFDGDDSTPVTEVFAGLAWSLGKGDDEAESSGQKKKGLLFSE